MPKIVHIRDVSDEVHAGLVAAADAQGMSLTRYLQRELEHLAKRAAVVQHNAAVVRRTQRVVGDRLDRATILAVLHEGRGE